MKNRAFLLITSLMVTVILLLVGMGLLGSQASRYEAIKQSSYISQARQLALAGLEDARIKLEMDVNFPPPQGPQQFQFSYSEVLDLPYPVPVQGSYSIVVDTTYNTDPIGYITVTSVGTVGPPISPNAQYRLRGEIDTASARGAAPHGIVSDRYFRYTHVQDEEVP